MNAGKQSPKLTPEEAAIVEAARERMVARHKLIEGMIRNNELQLKNESARGGAQLEFECAKRDANAPGAGADAQAAVETAARRFKVLEDEHRKLVAEREFLNTSLLEFESGSSDQEHKRSGHS